jgi:fibronectin type III domain protein
VARAKSLKSKQKRPLAQRLLLNHPAAADVFACIVAAFSMDHAGRFCRLTGGVCALNKLQSLNGKWSAVLLLMLLSACHDSGQSAAGPTGAPQSVSGGSATVSWEAPTTNTNGTALTDLSGYRIYYGSSANDLNQMIPVETIGIQTYVVDGLTAGTWYFAVRAVTSAGTESALSSVVDKTIT